MTRILNDSKTYFLSLTMSDLVSGISTINMVECLGTPDQNLSLVLDRFYDNSQEQIAGLNQILLYSHFESASKFECFCILWKMGQLFQLWNILWDCRTVVRFTMAIDRIYWDVWAEYCGCDSLSCITSKYESKIKLPSIQPGCSLMYCNNITVLLILFSRKPILRIFWRLPKVSQMLW